MLSYFNLDWKTLKWLDLQIILDRSCQKHFERHVRQEAENNVERQNYENLLKAASIWWFYCFKKQKQNKIQKKK